MSGVSARGDPCAATSFWSIVLPHLIYYASSPIPLTKYSVLTEQNHLIVAWFHKNVHLSDEILIQLKPLPCCSCRCLVVHISPTRPGELNGHQHQQNPCGWKTYILRGAARCPEGIVCDTAVTTSVPCSLRHDASHLGLVDQSPVCWPWTLPPPRRGRQGLDFWGKKIRNSVVSCAHFSPIYIWVYRATKAICYLWTSIVKCKDNWL
jgi:hypothetical protein